MENETNPSPENKMSAFPILFFVWNSFIVISLVVALFGAGLSLKYVNQLKINFDTKIQRLTQEIDLLKQTSLDSQQELTQKITQLQKSFENYSLQKNEIQNIKKLKLKPPLDQTALLAKSSDLMGRIKYLPLNTRFSHPPQEKPTSMPNWKHSLENSWQALQKIIVIRRIDQTMRFPLMPSQRFVLDQNIQWLLLQTQWAILQADPVLYKNSLAQVESWVKNYFDPEAQVTKDFLKDLSKLEEINIVAD